MLIINLIGAPVLGETASKIMSKMTRPSLGLLDSVDLPLMSRVSSRGKVSIL
jgi:hypothetical protein